MWKKLRENKLSTLLVKQKSMLQRAFFAFYNIFSIIVISYFLGESRSGELLVTLGVFQVASVFSRLGSDLYILDKGKGKIQFHNNEIIYQLIFSAIVSIIINEFYMNYGIVLIFLTILSVNLVVILARVYQAEGRHDLSLNVQVFYPIGFVPVILIYTGFDVSVFLYSNIILCFVLCFCFNKPKVTICISKSYFKRVNYLPVLMFGAFNQYLMSIYGHVFDGGDKVSTLFILQRSCGLLLWPMTIYMQKNLDIIRETKNFRVIDSLKKFLSLNLGWICMFFIVSMAIGLSTAYKVESEFDDKMIVFLSFILILSGTLINAMFGFLNYRIASQGKGSVFFIICLIASLIPVAFTMINISSYYLIGSLVFLTFHSFIFILNNIYLYRQKV